MIDLKSIKINNLTDHQSRGVYWQASLSLTYTRTENWGGFLPVGWENIWEFGYCSQAPLTGAGVGLDHVCQISLAWFMVQITWYQQSNVLRYQFIYLTEGINKLPY